ncbi:bifunctional riboflavin kinase/FAD synthetase [Brumicola nitratireducens]|uniref:Riboflavin biosynthesis protein n=1 Tax=Glaciecola nitratireducens (strain JCM 12485 / KCTC 12276 / FR1064) TaxID=1085623 RepID=G4QG25_GLANF|nr:bifunctional riboflavin kinase/FAD synthetase [Glaciecola nitratireducens]AEP29192.1 riboflavin biosynthesis protein RibF [Glaciecola nitratireducens FR1064]
MHHSNIKRQGGLQLIRGLHNLRQQHQKCVLTIGKFDGVHLGHQAVIVNLVEKAKALGLASTVMIFEPQPEEVFAPDHAPARLSRFRDKYEQFKALGIDRLVCVRFNPAFAGMSPESFIQDLLVEKLGVKFLVVGDDFRFGFQRRGNFEMLQEAGLHLGFNVVSTQSFKLANCRISSTEIREALANSDFELAKEMLGRDFTIAGRVNHGDKKGRTIGFPTANVLLKRCKSPVSGVFAVEVIIRKQRYKGVANIGNRPTVSGTRSQLEVHLFDFKQDLYGTFIEVAIKQKLRDEKKFDNFEELHQQIKRDAQAARDIFNI